MDILKIWGNESEKVYIYVHGMNGSAMDAEGFAGVAENYGWQVLSFDVPEFSPENTPHTLETIYTFAKEHWKNIALYAVSLGAWYSMIYFHDKPIIHTMLVSPVVSMKNLIERMMKSAGVTHDMLREQRTIENLSWDYYKFAEQNEITSWDCRTNIMYPEKDNITPSTEIEEFAEKFSCELFIMPDAEHWIHTEQQLKILRNWEEANIHA